MRRGCSLLVLTACWSQPPLAKNPPVQPSASTEEPFTDAVITGRVLVDGAPAPKLAIGWTARPVSEMHGNGRGRAGWLVGAVVVPQSERFELHVPPGKWSILFAGPSFARIALPERTLRANTITDLGDITPRAGFTITGLVTDSSGLPAAGAEVSIRNSVFEPMHDDPLIARLSGDFVTLTDKQGHYRLDGVTHLEVEKRAQLHARLPGREAALPRHIAAGDLTENIMLQPAGSIDGTSSSHSVFIHSGSSLMFTRVTNGTFEFPDLPAGTYVIGSQQVTVVTGQVTRVTLP